MEETGSRSQVEEAFISGFYQGIRSYRTRIEAFLDSMWIDEREECMKRMAHFIQEGKEHESTD